MINRKYKNLLQNILENGVWRDDPNRKGTKRLQIPFTTMSIDLRKGFPLLTTKKMWWKGIVVETLWLLRGENNIKYLVDNGVNIWNKDAYNWYLKNSNKTEDGHNDSLEDYIDYIKNNTKLYDEQMLLNKKGDLGRIYGTQWRNWDPIGKRDTLGIDQLQDAINKIKSNPLSSNIRIFGDNPSDENKQALPCCMDYMQFSCESIFGSNLNNERKLITTKEEVQVYVGERKSPIREYYLDLTIHYRSWDVLLGAPWNIAQYALILSIIAKITNTVPRYLNIVANNVHLYDNQIDAAKEHLERDPDKYDLPTLRMNKHMFEPDNNLDQMLRQAEVSDNFTLENYNSYPKLEKQPEMKAYE